ncbi:MAG: alpha-amylase [Acidobacteria bacterium]|nr:MAG: alpha-amylase [Acidobacteriota bacterium]PYY19479.1 MAG: alpha-amylase [Acidobacteriota bacterium]
MSAQALHSAVLLKDETREPRLAQLDRLAATVPAEAGADTLPPLRLHPQLYEISTLPWLLRLGKQLGRSIGISDVPHTEWERLRALGFDLVYLMGVWKRSPEGRRLSRSQISLFKRYDECLPGWTLNDVPGSPFSIQAYEPDPSIGTWDDFDALHRRLHELGMRLILDVIPNHTGPDHHWITEHPEYYIRGTLAQYRVNPGDFFIAENSSGGAEVIAYGRDPNFAPWTDTAQLNYFNPGLRAAMVEQIRRINEICDGARCDMAMLILNDHFHQTWESVLGSTPTPREEFWEEATRLFPNFIWIAEAYSDSEWALQQLGFNFTYDKRLYDRLRDGFVRDVYLHLKADLEFQRRSVRFLENHDEARAASVFGKSRLPAVAVLASTVPGMHFFNDGQFEGFQKQLVVQLSHAQEESADPEIQRIYEKVLTITDSPEFHNGVWKLLEVKDTGERTNSDLIAYRWSDSSGQKLVVVNLGASNSTGRIYFDDNVLSGAGLRFDDLLNDRSYERPTADLKRWGLFIKLAGFGAHIFDVKSIA